MALGTGWRTGGRALRCDYGATFAIVFAGIAGHLRRSFPGEAETDGHDACGSGMDGTREHHARTKGPGAFRYLFLIASNAQ